MLDMAAFICLCVLTASLATAKAIEATQSHRIASLELSLSKALEHILHLRALSIQNSLELESLNEIRDAVERTARESEFTRRNVEDAMRGRTYESSWQKIRSGLTHRDMDAKKHTWRQHTARKRAIEGLGGSDES